MKEISLERWYRPITISDNAYERIMRIINENKVCKKCDQLYTENNPQVALNLCKSCFLGREACSSLSFVGALSTSASGTAYGFLDREGYIYTTYSYKEHEIDRSIADTLRYWHFPVPEACEVKGRTERLHASNWSVYGDFKNASVVVIEYHEYHGDPFRKQFLAYKNGDIQELNRHKGDVRKLFAEARKRAEATKDANGHYHIHGYEMAQLYDSHLYQFIADIVNKEQSQIRTFER